MSIRPLVQALSILAVFILAIGGCQSTPRELPAEKTAPEPAAPTTQPAKTGLSAAAAAAREMLETAEGLQLEGDWVGATALFSALSHSDLAPADRPRYTLLAAQLAIRSGDLEKARQLLATLDTTRLPDPVDALLAEAWLTAATGAPARAAGQLMRARIPAAARQRANDAIWELATLTPALEALALAGRGSDAEQGWWALRRELLLSANLADQQARIEAWRASWPNHPATKNWPVALREPESGYVTPRRVALLLPLSGPLARAGRSVRDGFMTAWLERPVEERFEIAVYDTQSASLAEVYQQALAEGADVLIGPLAREAVTAMNDLAPTVPVLALNYLTAGDPAPNLVQLGLAIEDDVATLTAWLREAGLERIMVLHGPHEWAIRVQQALADQGIEPVAQHLLPEMRTVTESVGTAMHIEDSLARHAEVERLMNASLAFMPRARSDIDAVVALVNAVEVTALVPALRFHYADRIPAFATAQTLQGANAATLRAMEGFRVVELPWQVPGNPGQRAIADAFPLAGNPFASMYALGADAFRLADRIHPANRSGFAQILGNTGVLTLLPDGRLHRELARMEVRRGQLLPSEPAVGL